MALRASSPLLALLLWAAGPALADVPRLGAADEKVVAEPGIPYPTQEMVLRALPKGPARRNVRIWYQVQARRVGPARFFPLVGKGRLVQTHFQCTVISSNQGREVVYIDTSRIEPAR
jgi:hypothetical protein